MRVISTWQGKPLDEFTKEELIAIIIELGQLSEQNHLEHMRELSVLSGQQGGLDGRD